MAVPAWEQRAPDQGFRFGSTEQTR